MGRPARRLITDPHDTDKEHPVTASPMQVNGTKRPAALVLGDWQPVRFDRGATVWEKPPVEPEPADAPQPASPSQTADPVAEAEAEAIRVRAAAEAEAIRIKAVEEAERARIANERAAMRLEKEREDHAAKLAEVRKRREQTERETTAAREQDETAQQAAGVDQAKKRKSATSWKRAALTFAVVCAIVALPVQMSAFWSPKAPWLLIAPLVLEGGAWVVLRGAAAAVDDHRPHWHYRLIAWSLAFIAAGINLSHGLSHFDVATAGGTAFASLAGPGVWDLHEHGRIRVRDGVLTRRERKAQGRAEKRAAAEKAALEAQRSAEKEAAEKAAAEVVAKLAKDRAAKFPKVWEHALKLAAALGETTVTEAVWRRAHKDVEGTDPGDSAEAQQLRNAAARRMFDAQADAPDKAVWKYATTQRATHLYPATNSGPKPARNKPVPPRRQRGDSLPFHPVAKALAAEAKRRPTALGNASEGQ